METFVTLILIAVCMTVLVAMHLHLTSRPAQPITVPSTDEIDAEFFRIVGREWLREQDRNPETLGGSSTA